MSASLTRNLAVALDLATLAFVAKHKDHLSASSGISPQKNRGRWLGTACNNACSQQKSRKQEMRHSISDRSGIIVPCDRNIPIPLCSRLRSVGLFRLPLGRLGGRGRRLVASARPRRCPLYLRRLRSHDTQGAWVLRRAVGANGGERVRRDSSRGLPLPQIWADSSHMPRSDWLHQLYCFSYSKHFPF